MKFYLVFLTLLLNLSSSAYAELAGKRTFLASTLPYPPYQYPDPITGEATGVAVDIINELFRRTGQGEVEFSFYPLQSTLYPSQSGQAGLLFNAGIDSSRQEWGIYLDNSVVLVETSYDAMEEMKQDGFYAAILKRYKE